MSHFDVSIIAYDLENRRNNEDEISEYYMKKYADRPTAGHMENDYSFVDDDISEQQLLPDVHDPNLWIAKCVIGTERECALKLMRKFLVHQSKVKQHLKYVSSVFK